MHDAPINSRRPVPLLGVLACLLFLSLSHAGFRSPPTLEWSNTYRTQGRAICDWVGGGRGGSAYVVDGVKYFDSYGEVFGWRGTGCRREAMGIGRDVEVVWIAIDGSISKRLAIQVSDAKTGYRYSGDEKTLQKRWTHASESGKFDNELDLPLGLLAAFFVILYIVGCKKDLTCLVISRQ